MGSIEQILLDRRAEAIAKVQVALRRDPFFEEMSPADLKARNGRDTGWFTTENVEGVDRRLEFHLPLKFPDVPPIIKIEGGAKHLFLENPHVFRSGWICVLPNSASVDANQPENLVYYCVNQAFEILTQDHSDDFRDEFSIYWSIDSGGNSKRFLLVEPLENLEGSCCAELLDKYVVIGASDESITRWVSAFLGEPAHGGKIRPCLIVDFDSPLNPAQYPKTVWDVRELVKTGAPKTLKSLDDLLCDSSRFFTVLFRQQTDEGPVLAGIVALGEGLRKRKKIAGFRAGKIPRMILIAAGKNELKKSPIDRGIVQRVDHQWIHTRGGDGEDLTKKKVLLVGCGSLGGYVGHLLSRAGIGSLTLIDNDKLEWENVGRHVLGASMVGESKAKALCERIQLELPHLFTEYFYGDWRDWIAEGNSEKFDEFDLVVSTVGDWSCERPLNLLKQRESSPPLLFGWIEPHGVAGHALLSHNSGGCLECGFDQFGHFSRAVAKFEASTLTKEPGGCTYYQEYGPLNVIPVAEMVSKFALDVLNAAPTRSSLRSWIGSISKIAKHGGELTEIWQNMGASEFHSQVVELEWAKSENCNICS